MTDEEAIQRTLNTYSQAASVGDWDRATNTYMPDGVWTIPHLDMTLEGRQAIRGALTSFMATMDYVVQMNTPAVIDVEGDTATATSNIREGGKMAGKDQAFEFFGQYVDKLQRTAEGWQFEQRLFRGFGSHYFPLDQGESH